MRIYINKSDETMSMVIGRYTGLVSVSSLFIAEFNNLDPTFALYGSRDRIGTFLNTDTYVRTGAEATTLLNEKEVAWLRKYARKVVTQLFACFCGEFEGKAYHSAVRLRNLYDVQRENRVLIFHERTYLYYANTSSNRAQITYVYGQHKKFNKLLNEHVKQALKASDSSDLESFLIDESSGHAKDWIKNVYGKLDSLLSLDLVLCECGHIERSEDTQEVYNGSRFRETWCQLCVDDDARWCEDTDDYRAGEYAYEHSDGCYYSYEEERDEDEDEDSDEDVNTRGLMDYSTNVLTYAPADANIKSNSYGEFTLGIEFEMTSGDRNSGAAAEQVRACLGESYCIVKRDGSLPDNGFEIVTAPRGLIEHVAKFKAWDIDSKYCAWDVGSCGMHVHIDSRAFTSLTLGKFIMFVNSTDNVDFIRKIAGRHPAKDAQARSYCDTEFTPSLENPIKALKGKGSNRYYMVNLTNLRRSESERLGFDDRFTDGRFNTVELRIFRSSLKKERLLAQIEFAHACVCFCRASSYRELNGTTFIKWLKTQEGQYPHLADWYGVRRKNKAPTEATCADKTPESVTS